MGVMRAHNQFSCIIPGDPMGSQGALQERGWSRSGVGPQGKEWGQPLEAGKGKKTDLPLDPPEGRQSSQPRSSGILTSRTVGV